VRQLVENGIRISPDAKSEVTFHGGGGGGAPLEPAFKRVMMFLFVATRGGDNRIKIVRLLRQQPTNANKICEQLGLDYKTVQHHLRILDENQVVVSSSPKGTYGAVYFLAPYFEKQIDNLENLWVKSGKR
jgi:DNA-binding transcriptional ArsR family regulator